MQQISEIPHSLDSSSDDLNEPSPVSSLSAATGGSKLIDNHTVVLIISLIMLVSVTAIGFILMNGKSDTKAEDLTSSDVNEEIGVDKSHTVDSEVVVLRDDVRSALGRYSAAAPDEILQAALEESGVQSKQEVIDRIEDQLIYLQAFNNQLYIMGNVDDQGKPTFDYWYSKRDIELEVIIPGAYLFTFWDKFGKQLLELSVNSSYLGESGPFSLWIPDPDGTRKVEVRHGDELIFVKDVSENIPTATIQTPELHGAYSGIVPVRWQASDIDGDDLQVALGYTQDHFGLITDIDRHITGDSYDWDVSGLAAGEYQLGMSVSDGYNVYYISSKVFTIIK